MIPDFETLPIGTEAALRRLALILDMIGQTHQLRIGQRLAIRHARAILAQIDAQRKGATDAG